MYKEYHHRGLPLRGNSEAQSWDLLWSKMSLSSDSRLKENLRHTPQWREIAKVVRPGWTVLEAGCGLGHWVRFFAHRNLKPIGLDYSEPTIERLRAEFPTMTWITGDIRAMEFADESFDMVVSWGVIEHLEEGPHKAWAEFFRVLKKGGFIFVTVPWLSPARLRRGFAVDGDNLAELESGESQFSQYYFTEAELVASAEVAGFCVMRTCPAAIHAKSLLPASFRDKYRLAAKLFNRLFSSVLPERLIAHMILLVGTKPVPPGSSF